MSLHNVNVKFVVRGLLFALPVAAITTVVILRLMVTQSWIYPFPAPTPLPPTLLVPRGELPAGPGGLEEWVQARDKPYVLAGSGFLLALDDGEVVGVTTAHSVPFGNPAHPVERIALRVAGQAEFVAEFDTLRGRPGRPFAGDNLALAYVLLWIDRPPGADLLLTPDPRGAPQPGERVLLFSGLGDGHGGRCILEGTVQSVSDTAVWVVMDGWFAPGSMSGSPLVSQHTGQVVGMAIAVSPRRNRLLLGAHPIGSIVQLAESAAEFPKIREYRR